MNQRKPFQTKMTYFIKIITFFRRFVKISSVLILTLLTWSSLVREAEKEIFLFKQFQFCSLLLLLLSDKSTKFIMKPRWNEQINGAQVDLLREYFASNLFIFIKVSSFNDLQICTIFFTWFYPELNNLFPKTIYIFWNSFFLFYLHQRFV